jgi:hypothetical protein
MRMVRISFFVLTAIVLAASSARAQWINPSWFRPDLRIMSVAHSPSSWFAVTAVVRNQGNMAVYSFPAVSTTPRIKVTHWSSGGLKIGSAEAMLSFPWPLCSLKPGQEYTVTLVLPSPVLPGTFLHFEVDPTDVVDELVESNNKFEWLVTS